MSDYNRGTSRFSGSKTYSSGPKRSDGGSKIKSSRCLGEENELRPHVSMCHPPDIQRKNRVSGGILVIPQTMEITDMMKPHCDRCDKDMQDESFCSWVEITKPFGMTEKMVIHFHLSGSGSDLMLCKDCTALIHVAYLQSIGISAAIRHDLFSVIYPPESLTPAIPATLPDPGRPLSVDANTDDDIPL